eukprot:gene21612-27651_t
MGNLAAAGSSAFLDYKVDNADSLTTKLIEKPSVVKAILSVNPSDISRSNKLSHSSKQGSNQSLVILTTDLPLLKTNSTETEGSLHDGGSAADDIEIENEDSGVDNNGGSIRQSISASVDSPTTPSSKDQTSTKFQSHSKDSQEESSERNDSPDGSRPGNISIVSTTSVNFTNTLAQDFYQSKLPLHIACEHKASVGVVSLLIEAYPEAVSILGSDSMYPLHYALCSKNCLEVVTALSTRCPEHLTHRDRRGRMPFHYGLEKGCSEAVLLFLLQTQPLVASYRGYGAPGNYPLSTAIEKHCSSLVLTTLVHAFPAAVREVNLNNVLPLQSAVKHKCDIEVIQLLLTTHPAAADVTDTYNRTSLHYAISRNNPLRYVEDLISAGPDVPVPPPVRRKGSKSDPSSPRQIEVIFRLDEMGFLSYEVVDCLSNEDSVDEGHIQQVEGAVKMLLVEVEVKGGGGNVVEGGGVIDEVSESVVQTLFGEL